MEIIFESSEERDLFFKAVCCTNESGWEAMNITPGVSTQDCGVHNCKQCWENSGLKYKIVPRTCDNCKYEDRSEWEEPCKDCIVNHCNFVAKD